MDRQQTAAMLCNQIEDQLVTEAKNKADILRQLTTHALITHGSGISSSEHDEMEQSIRGHLDRAARAVAHEKERLEFLHRSHAACAELVTRFPDESVDYTNDPTYIALAREEIFWQDKFSGRVPSAGILESILGDALRGDGPGIQVIDLDALFTVAPEINYGDESEHNDAPELR